MFQNAETADMHERGNAVIGRGFEWAKFCEMKEDVMRLATDRMGHTG